MEILYKKVPQKLKIVSLIIFIFTLVVALQKYIPVEIKNFLFLITTIIKQIFLLLIPFIIFPFIVNSILSIGIQGTYLFATIIITVIISNFVAIMIPYLIGIYIIPKFDFNNINLYSQPTKLHDIVNINIPTIIGIEKTVLLAVLTGFFLHFYEIRKFPLIDYTLKKYHKLTTILLERFFPFLLPIYALGAILDAYSKTNFFTILFVFGKIILMIIFIQASYITFLFLVGAQGKIKEIVRLIRNSIESAVVGFFTMSSIATLPITLKAAENNTKDYETSRIIITTTVNCNDIGDSISLPLIALTIFYIFNVSFPTFTDYLYFSLTLALAQFGSLSIPGGSCIIIIPLLIKYLNFDPEMTDLLISIAIFIEPLGTAGNVMGNNAFVVLVRKIYLFITSSFKNVK